MPLSMGDRKIFVIGGFAVAVVLILIGFFSGSDRNDPGFPSSYNTNRRGGKAAYLLLRQLGYNIERWEDPPDALPQPSRGTVVILPSPTRWPEQGESEALHKWIATGGTLLVTETRTNILTPFAHTKSGDFRESTSDCVPSAPTSLSRGGPISMSDTLAWEPKGDLSQVVHYSCGKDAVVVSYKVGEGRVIWWASSDPLTNAGIREKNNLDLLLNSVAGARHILWNEYYFSTPRGPWSYASSRTLRYAIWDVVLLSIVVLFTFARRSGPLVSLHQASRLSPLEFVDTLGKLYHKAGAAQAVVEVAFNRFRQLLAHHMGLHGHLTAEQMNAAIEARGALPGSKLAATLRRCEDAITDPSLTEREALQLVRDLADGARALRLIKLDLQEKVDARHTATAGAH